MSESSLKNDLFDAVLKEAVAQLKEEELQKSEQFFEEHKGEDYRPSKQFLKKMKRDYWVYCIKRSLSSRALKRVASVLLVVGVLSGSLVFLAEANDISLYETIFLREERYTSIETYKQIVSGDHEASLDYFYFPKYIPVGFEIVDELSTEYSYYVCLKNGDDYFCLSQEKMDEMSQVRLDTEGAMVQEIALNGEKGMYIEKEDIKGIHLNTEKHSIDIYGNIEKQELFRIAENLELLEK